ncbi:MAG: WG repeat-containing protein [Lachnospiraceae bacterium]|nr:WG repeat-containing protein [Lachnospiraceae bacterium]
MKSYRKLVPPAMILIMVLSWYLLITETRETKDEYGGYLSEARKYADIGVTKYAVENYRKALALSPSPELYTEVAQYYKGQEKKEEELLAWCEEFLEQYPKEPKAYDCLLETYRLQEDYASCYDILYTADKRKVSSEYLTEIRKEIEYVYKMDFNTYDDVSIYSNNYCAVKSKDAWGYVDRYGNQRISATYAEAAAFTKSNFAPVINSRGEAYFIDKSGSRVLASKENYRSFGILADEKILAQLENGKFVYVNEEFQKLSEEYDEATAMNGGVAAVRTGEKWKLVGPEFEELSSETFDSVVVDEKRIAYRNDRLFVESGGKILMVDSSGRQVGSQTYEDARIFSDGTYAAVKQKGQWYFVDKDGTPKSEKRYEDARSYANGLAAVKINGKWGFVDEEEEIKIEPSFFGAKDFNEKGSCFVQTGDKWQLLKLYRLNREE